MSMLPALPAPAPENQCPGIFSGFSLTDHHSLHKAPQPVGTENYVGEAGGGGSCRGNFGVQLVYRDVSEEVALLGLSLMARETMGAPRWWGLMFLYLTHFLREHTPRVSICL